MKKQVTRLGALLLCLLLVLPTLVWAMPGDGDDVVAGYYGAEEPDFTINKTNSGVDRLNGSLTMNNPYYNFGDSYYNIDGTANYALTTSAGAYVDYAAKANVYEMDFMLGNETTGVDMRFRTAKSTGSGNNDAFNVADGWYVGSTVGGVTLEANKWYRVAAVFATGATEGTYDYSVYFNGVLVAGPTTIDGKNLNIYRIAPVTKEKSVAVDLSLDNIRAYTTANAYSAGAAATLTSKAGSYEVAGNVITATYGAKVAELANENVDVCVLVDGEVVTSGTLTTGGEVIARHKTSGRYAYYTLEVGGAPEPATITAVDAAVGTLDAQTITVKRGTTAGQLKAGITAEEGATVKVYAADKSIEVADDVEVRTGLFVGVLKEGAPTNYYTLQDSYNSYVRYDFDTTEPSTYMTANGNHEIVVDAELNSKVLKVMPTHNTNSAGFTVKSFAFSGPYVITYDLKRQGDSTVSQAFNGTNPKIISVGPGSVQLLNNVRLSGGARPGEWTRYAAYVDPDNMKARLYINGEQIGEELTIAEGTQNLTPTSSATSFRFFVQTPGTTVWVDNFEIYPATEADCARLAQPLIQVGAVAESGVAVLALPNAMGKITGAIGADVAALNTKLTAGEGVTLKVYTADGTLVESGAIEKGMILKASKGVFAEVYTFTDVRAEYIDYEITDGSTENEKKLKFNLDSYDSNVVIIAIYNGNNLEIADLVNVSAGYYTKTVTYTSDQKVKVFVWEDATDLTPVCEVIDTSVIQ